MRKLWIDNLRWFVVILVVVYHVFYMFNASGVFGGLPPFAERQPQDALLYLMYPWFMVVLFLVAGMSARYALQSCSTRQFSKSRTTKLLVPSTIGLLVFYWIVGYFNMKGAGGSFGDAPIPAPVRWLIFALSGTGPLWFIQELWLLSMLLLLVRKLDSRDAFYSRCGTFFSTTLGAALLLIIGVLLLWGASATVVYSNGLLMLYRPTFYLVPFLLGYFIFASEAVIEKLAQYWVLLAALFAIMAVIFILKWYPENYTSEECLRHLTTNAFAWIGSLAMIAVFKRWFDTRRTRFAGYMTRSSFGIYCLHYLPLVVGAYYLKQTALSPWIIYTLLLIAVPLASLAMWEIISRIPLLRWCVLGIKKQRK